MRHRSQAFIRLARSTYVKANTQVALGLLLGSDPSDGTPTDTDQWIEILNPGGNLAPGGQVNAYAVNADDATGVVGIQAIPNDGSTLADDSVIIIRPAYQDLTAASTTIFAASQM